MESEWEVTENKMDGGKKNSSKKNNGIKNIVKQFKKGDILVFLFPFLVTALIFMFLASLDSTHLIGEIKSESNVLYTIDLTSGEDEVFEIEGINGRKVVVEAKDGQMRFQSAECPDHLCVNTGWISSPGRAAVCLPNKIVISISGDSKSSDGVDAITN